MIDAPAIESPIAKDIVGYWKVSHGPRPGVVQFTNGGTAIYAWRFDDDNDTGAEQMATAKYVFVKDNVVEIRDGSTRYRMEVEVLSQDEVAVRVTSGCCIFDDLSGRLTRTKDGTLASPSTSGKKRPRVPKTNITTNNNGSSQESAEFAKRVRDTYKQSIERDNPTHDPVIDAMIKAGTYKK